MIDFVVDKELEKYAKEYGFSKIKAIKIIKVKSKNEIWKELKNEFNVVEGNSKLNRDILKNKKVNILLSAEKDIKKDSLHFRNSGLDQVACKIAAKNKIAIGFSFKEVLCKKMERAELIGRMMQNAKLCRKYRVKVVLGSFASKKEELRNSKDLEAFGRVIGINRLDNENIFKYKEFTGVIEVQ